MSTIPALIERLRAAEGPDRGLDARIHILLAGGSEADADYAATDPDLTCAPLRYTESVDAALTLVPEAHLWELRHGVEARAIVWNMETDYGEAGHDVPKGYHATSPAIALCIAALEARHLIATKRG